MWKFIEANKEDHNKRKPKFLIEVTQNIFPRRLLTQHMDLPNNDHNLTNIRTYILTLPASIIHCNLARNRLIQDRFNPIIFIRF